MRPTDPTREETLNALLPRLRRYRVGAVFVLHEDAPAFVEALRARLPDAAALDLLGSRTGADLEALLAQDVVGWTEAAHMQAPAVVTGSEALWTPLATRKQEDAWRALTLTEFPPAPRLLLLHSPHFLDRYQRALAHSPEPRRLMRWTL